MKTVKFIIFFSLINLLKSELTQLEIRHRKSRFFIRHRRNNNNNNNNLKKIKQNGFFNETFFEIENNNNSNQNLFDDFTSKTYQSNSSADQNISQFDGFFNYRNKFNENTTTTTTTISGSITSFSTTTTTTTNNNNNNDNKESDVVSHFLRIVETQHLLGENCTAGTNLTLREGVVDRYAQERFRVQANVAVNKANMLTRLWKYADQEVLNSEYLLYASVFSMVEFDSIIFAAGNCYDKYEYKDYLLFCPYAYRLPNGQIFVKDLAVEYKYLSNSSEWFFKARKNAEKVIKNNSQYSKGYTSFRFNVTTHGDRIPEEILSVTYEDGKWSKPYYDCGGGNIWMLTYTVPFFGYRNGSYFFKGTSGIDIDLRHVDIDQCPTPEGQTKLNIFADSAKCKKTTTMCVAIKSLGFRRGSYQCVCKTGFYFPETTSSQRYYNGTEIEEEYEKKMLGLPNNYDNGMFECLACPEGCDSCTDDRPCVVSLNWVTRTALLTLSCLIACWLPVILFYTWKWQHLKVIRAASPVLLRMIAIGAFFMYATMIVTYFKPTVYHCTARIWLREIGFALTYGALMLKTWRISLIFRVRSAKVVKITDISLLKKLGIILLFFITLLIVRTIVAPPIVIVGRTENDLKAYLCRTDLWDNFFSVVEIAFLIWGIRLCVVVRNAPSEFNESKYISLAIYNEFILCLFLNVTTFFLQKPANPDLMYIIYFVHTQLSVTLLLLLIFGSKVIMVIKDKDKEPSESSSMVYKSPSQFLSKTRNKIQYKPETSSDAGPELFYSKYSEQDIHEEFSRLYTQLELLQERNMRIGNRFLASKINAMQDAAKLCDTNDNDKSFIAIKSSSSCLSISISAAEKSTGNSAGDDNDGGDGGTEWTSTQIQRQHSVSFEINNDKGNFINDNELKLMSNDKLENNSLGKTNYRNSISTNVVVNSSSSSPPPPPPPTTTTVTATTKEKMIKNNDKTMMAGHARTHSIIINLDDKSLFTDEVSV